MNGPAMFGADIDADADVADPLDLLDLWLGRVGGPGGGTDVSTTPLMALATVDADGDPRVRHVLLSAYDRGRLHFHTDARSAKAAQLARHPRAAATIVWPDIPRQLCVSGSVEPESTTEQAAAFARRSRYLQLLAWVNEPELTALDDSERRARFDAFDADHATLSPPPTWTGAVLIAERISFWRGGPDGPSQRIACRRVGEVWSVERLPG